jgi:hypothetical protein
MKNYNVLSRTVGCSSPEVRCYTIVIKAIRGNAFNFQFVLPYLLGHVVVILFSFSSLGCTVCSFYVLFVPGYNVDCGM